MGRSVRTVGAMEGEPTMAELAAQVVGPARPELRAAAGSKSFVVVAALTTLVASAWSILALLINSFSFPDAISRSLGSFSAGSSGWSSSASF